MLTIQDLLSTAVATHRAGEVARAASLYGLILRFDPAHPDALHLGGLVHQQRGDWKAAVAWMERGNRIDASLAGRHAERGDALRQLGRNEAAAEAYRCSLRRRPDHSDTLFALAETLRRIDRIEEARASYRRAIALQPDLPEAHYGLGVMAYGDNTVLAATSHGEAAHQFRRAVILRRDHVLAWINLGVILYMLGNLRQAGRACRNALSVNPGFDRAIMRLGQTWLASGDLDAAWVALRRAVAIDPTDPEAVGMRDRAAEHRRLSIWAGDMSLPEGLALRGTFRNTSGYAYMVRQFVRQLDAAGVRLHLLDVPLSFLQTMSAEKREPFFERFDQPIRARALLNFVIPNLAEPVPGLDSIVFSMSETRSVPPDWLAYSLRQRHLIVPTPSSVDAWTRSGFPVERIHLCPLGVDPRPLSTGISAMMIGDGVGRRFSDYRARFLNISDLTLRKNLDGLLRVWLRATGPDDDAALLLKLGKGNAGEDALVRGLISSAVAATGRRTSDAAPIFLVSGSFSDDEMTSMMAAATHYWSMSHGEGWDLPMTQAGAMGLTLIAPRHSAYTAYLNEDVALMLPASPSPGRAPYCGLEWWSADEEAAANILACVIREGLTPPRSARDRLARDFTWEQAGRRLVETLGGIRALG